MISPTKEKTDVACLIAPIFTDKTLSRLGSYHSSFIGVLAEQAEDTVSNSGPLLMLPASWLNNLYTGSRLIPTPYPMIAKKTELCEKSKKML